MLRDLLKVLCFVLLTSFAAAQLTCQPNDEGLFFPIVDDRECRSYGVCWGGEFLVDTCPAGFRFNPATSVCDCIGNVQCGPQEPPLLVCPPTGLHQIRHPDNCYQFIICVAGVPNERSCSPGLFFSSAFARCVRRAQSDCIEPGLCPEFDDPFDVIFIPDPEDCQIYFICEF